MFVLLVILVSISGIYEWAGTDPALSRHLNFTQPSGFESDAIISDVEAIGFEASSEVETSERTDLVAYIGSLLASFAGAFGLIMRLLFGWILLIQAVFASMGLEFLAIVFIPPIAIIQLIGIVYFLRDIVNTIRGVG